jgi:putative hydrolase of the HAD superfamily
MDFKAVIFDLDDTLFPERDYVFSGYRAVAQAFASLLGDVDAALGRMRQLYGTPHRRRVFNQMLQENSLADDPQIVLQMVDAYRKHQPTIRLFPDADRALKRLRGVVRLGLITDGPAIMQRAKIRALNLVEAGTELSGPVVSDANRNTLDVILLTDELGPGYAKPHPRAFELASRRLGVPATSCTYVADNPAKDFVAPNALGWTTVHVVRAGSVYGNEAAAKGGEARLVVNSLDRIFPNLPE